MVKICCEKYPENTAYETYFNTYPYDLSDFQKYAIEAIVEGQGTQTAASATTGFAA